MIFSYYRSRIKYRYSIFLILILSTTLYSSFGLCKGHKPIDCEDIIENISKENKRIADDELLTFLRCYSVEEECQEIKSGKHQVGTVGEFRAAQERIDNGTRMKYEQISKWCLDTESPGFHTSCIRKQLKIEQQYYRTGLYGLFIRGPNDIISISELQDSSSKVRKAFKNASSAKLALQISVPSGDDTNIVKGTLLYPVSLMSKPELTGDDIELSAAYLIPSVSIDSEKKANEKEGSDSLIFRFGMALGAANLFNINSQYFRLNLIYGTDTSFDSRIPGVEFQWEPLHFGTGLGSDFTIFNEMSKFRWRFFLQGEYLTPSDTEGTPLENSSDHISRFGAQIIVNFWPFKNTLAGLKLYGTASYLLGIEGDPGTTDYFTIGAAYDLDKHGKFSIDGKFETGRLPITYEGVNRYSIGLGIKY